MLLADQKAIPNCISVDQRRTHVCDNVRMFMNGVAYDTHALARSYCRSIACAVCSTIYTQSITVNRRHYCWSGGPGRGCLLHLQMPWRQEKKRPAPQI